MLNLIICDGCGEQIEAQSAYQCVGCKKHFCDECETPMPIVCLCPECEKWAEGIMADCEQRKQKFIVDRVKAAMAILEQSPCGPVGKYGLNRDQLEVQPDDTNHYATQSAWLELNELLETIT